MPTRRNQKIRVAMGVEACWIFSSPSRLVLTDGLETRLPALTLGKRLGKSFHDLCNSVHMCAYQVINVPKSTIIFQTFITNLASSCHSSYLILRYSFERCVAPCLCSGWNDVSGAQLKINRARGNEADVTFNQPDPRDCCPRITVSTQLPSVAIKIQTL